MSLADWVTSASSICSSVSTSPVRMGTVDWSLCNSVSYSATSAAVMVIGGPLLPAAIG